MTVTSENYFNLKAVFLELIGDPWIILLVGLAVLSYKAIEMNMPWQIVGLLSIVWSLAVFSIATGTLILVYIMIILSVAVYFYFMYSRKAERG